MKLAAKVPPTEKELHKRALQGLASRVQDEAHWREILAGAPNQASRDELERVVGPLLRFRRERACASPTCTSGKRGEWQPVLNLVSPLAPDEKHWVNIELWLCTECHEDAVPQDFLTEGIWAQVMENWADPTAPPVRSRTTLTWDRVN